MSRVRIKRSTEELVKDEPPVKRARTDPCVVVSISCFPTVASARSAKILAVKGAVEQEDEADEWSESEERVLPPVAAFLARTRPMTTAPVVPAVVSAAPASAGVQMPGSLVLRSGEQMYGIRHSEISSVPADCPPLTAADCVGVGVGAAAETLMAPFAARWFSWSGTSEVERRTALRAGISDLARYVELRNLLIAAYSRTPLQYLSVRGAREQTGESDISVLVRVWAIADYLGLVNFSCDPTTAPRQAKRLLDWQTADGTGSTTTPAVGSAVSQTRETAFGRLHSCDCCGKTLHFAAHFSSARSHNVTLCTRCFGAGRFPLGLSEEHFDRVEDLALDERNWSEEETLTLLEALERFGDHDWLAVSAHVKRPIDQCLVHFASLPIEDRFCEPILADDCRDGRDSAKASTANPFADLDNPLMTLLSFLSSTVHPVVASAAAKRAFDCAATGKTEEAELMDEAYDGASEQAEKMQQIEKANIASLFPKIIDLQLKKLELKHFRLQKLLPGNQVSSQQ